MMLQGLKYSGSLLSLLPTCKTSSNERVRVLERHNIPFKGYSYLKCWQTCVWKFLSLPLLPIQCEMYCWKQLHSNFICLLEEFYRKIQKALCLGISECKKQTFFQSPQCDTCRYVHCYSSDTTGDRDKKRRGEEML